MQYLALLRGINVGGKSIIKMSDLKDTVEKCGFINVSTYIQSGNVIFESDERDIYKIDLKLEDSLLKRFNYDIRIIVKTYDQLKKILLEIPEDWRSRNDLRCYLAFIKSPMTAQDVMQEIELKEGIDFIKVGDGVLYMSTLLSGLTRSRFTKLITKKVYKEITIRNFKTMQKLFILMQREK